MISKMQKLPALIFLAFLAWTFSACNDVLGIKGKGDLVTEVRDVKNFHAVDIGTNGELELRVDSVFHVEVTCEESIIAYLQTIEDNGVLKIHFDRDVYDVDNLKIIVSAPSWDGIEIAGSVDVDVPDAISGTTLDLRISGSGDMKIFNANFDEIRSTISGSGAISLDGVADHLKCTISGSGDLNALGCPVLTAEVTISGSGDVRLDVSESLFVTISGSGNVDYRGNPLVTTNISGSGTVRKI
jgi:hypothetical protein